MLSGINLAMRGVYIQRMVYQTKLASLIKGLTRAHTLTHKRSYINRCLLLSIQSIRTKNPCDNYFCSYRAVCIFSLSSFPFTLIEVMGEISFRHPYMCCSLARIVAVASQKEKKLMKSNGKIHCAMSRRCIWRTGISTRMNALLIASLLSLRRFFFHSLFEFRFRAFKAKRHAYTAHKFVLDEMRTEKDRRSKKKNSVRPRLQINNRREKPLENVCTHRTEFHLKYAN